LSSDRAIERNPTMRWSPNLSCALVVLAALAVTACQVIVIRPPTDAAGDYASHGPGER
jgi:hypothetical protein